MVENFLRVHLYFRQDFMHDWDLFQQLILADENVTREANTKSGRGINSAALRHLIKTYNRANKSKLVKKPEVINERALTISDSNDS